MSDDEYVLGIDGGGTSTIAWLALRERCASFKTVGVGRSGPSNLRVVGFDQASGHVDTALDQAFGSAGMSRCQVSSICIAMAGSDRNAERDQWQAWAKINQPVARRIIVTNDAIPVIYAADAGGQGVALIVGTGSLALGRTRDGTTARSGGWGPLIGDEGSGYAIAIAGLRAVAKAADGRGNATELAPSYCQALGVDRPSEIISVLYSPAYDRPKIASLASTVFDAAGKGDAVATAIIDRAACDLASMVRSVVSQLSLDSSSSVLAITGGVALNQVGLIDQVIAQLRNDSIVFANRSLQHDPVAGAVQMAVNALI